MAKLDELGVGTEIWPMPVEIPDAIAFPDDRVHASYDGEAVRRFWLALVQNCGPHVSRLLRRSGFASGCTLGRRARRVHPPLRARPHRTAPDPDAMLLEFLQSTYEAAAATAGWDRAALERRESTADTEVTG